MKEEIQKNAYKIRQIIKNFTGNYNEDLEQEVYIKTYKNLPKYKEQNKFSQWICAITANVCRDYLKSANFKKGQVTDNDEEAILNAKTNETPETVYSAKERQRIILKEIDRLPKKMKEVIVLYEFENYSYDDLSKKLKVPVGTVKSRINSARKILSEKLAFLIGED